jgi:hypothetical protein
MPCSGRCGETKCPELCLCTEVLQLFDFSLYAFHDNHSSIMWKNEMVRHNIYFVLYNYYFVHNFSFCFCGFLHFVQVFCCFGNSVASTRFLLQDEFNIQTTQCDNCIIVLLSLSRPKKNILYTLALLLCHPHVCHSTHCLLCRDSCSASNNLLVYSP